MKRIRAPHSLPSFLWKLRERFHSSVCSGLAAPQRIRLPSSPSRWNLAAILVFALATAGLMAVTGNTGGDIRHAEILVGQDAQSPAGVAGAKLIEGIHYFVIDFSMWIWPILEDLHFIGLILLLGTVGVFNLRILGFLKRLPLAPLHRFLPWGIAGFGINVITGFFFYLGMPGFYVLNFVFQLKILTIFVAGGTSAVVSLHQSVSQAGKPWPRGGRASILAKLIALSSIVLWILVIILGRYIPFGEVT